MKRVPPLADHCQHCGLTTLDAARAEKHLASFSPVTIIRHGECKHVIAWRSGGRGPLLLAEPSASYIVEEHEANDQKRP